MPGRVPFTEEHAGLLFDTRVRRCLSQYELADKLGWVRSKIKRIERHEIKSIKLEDLDALHKALRVRKADLAKLPEADVPPTSPSKSPKTTNTTSTRPDAGRPKPRLDYDKGRAVIIWAMRDARARGIERVKRGVLERLTGFTAVQVRTFCKSLAKDGILERQGRYKAMRYVLLWDEDKFGDMELPVHAPPVRTPVVRQIIDDARRRAAVTTIVPELREKVEIPAWLMEMVLEEGIGDLTLAEVWGQQ